MLPINPTRIYIKQCPHCGLKYMGKSVIDDIEKYQGSGLLWRRHLKKHNITPTHVWNSDWFYDTSIIEYALKLSEEYNIVESDEWANMKPETGTDGGDTSSSPNFQRNRHLMGKPGNSNPMKDPAICDKNHVSQRGQKRPNTASKAILTWQDPEISFMRKLRVCCIHCMKELTIQNLGNHQRSHKCQPTNIQQ